MSSSKSRNAKIERNTKETQIAVAVDLDTAAEPVINTGIGFFDHMLTHIGHHAHIALTVKADGDLHVDEHHTVEDVGIALGKVVSEALGDKTRIERYGWVCVPMDEALVLVALDFSGRPALNFDMKLKREKVGDFSTELVEEFYTAFTRTAGVTLHIKCFNGYNDHHIIEAAFKAFAKALHIATRISTTYQNSSTKGVID